MNSGPSTITQRAGLGAIPSPLRYLEAPRAPQGEIRLKAERLAELRTALFGKEAQDEHPYFYRSVLRNQQRRDAIEGFAQGVFTAYLDQVPAAPRVEMQTFLSDLNKLIAWGLSDDNRCKSSDEIRRFESNLGQGSVKEFRRQLSELFDKFAARPRDLETEILEWYSQKLLPEQKPDLREDLRQRYKSDLSTAFDVLQIVDSRLQFNVVIQMFSIMNNFDKLNPEDKEQALVRMESFSRGGNLAYPRYNHDDTAFQAVAFLGGAKNCLWAMQSAQAIAPVPGCLKSYLEFLALRLESLYEAGVFSADGRRGPRSLLELNRLIEPESDSHLRINPWMEYAIRDFADCIAFQRLKIIQPELAQSSPNVTMPHNIISSIINDHLTDKNGHPRYRELDSDSLEKIDAALLDYFTKKK